MLELMHQKQTNSSIARKIEIHNSSPADSSTKKANSEKLVHWLMTSEGLQKEFGYNTANCMLLTQTGCELHTWRERYSSDLSRKWANMRKWRFLYPHSKEKRRTYRFYVTVQEPNLVHVLNRLEHLHAQAKSGWSGEDALGLAAAHLGEVPTEQLHDDVVEPVVAPAPVKLAHVVPTLELLQHGHLHVEHLLRLPGGFEFDCHRGGGSEVNCFIDFAETSGSDFWQLAEKTTRAEFWRDFRSLKCEVLHS